MKHLTTFLYGIILLGISFFVISEHTDFKSSWDYFCVIAGILIGFSGLDKLDKLTN